MLCSMFSVFDPSCNMFGYVIGFKWFMLLSVFLLWNWQYFYLTTGLSFLTSNISSVTISMMKVSFSKSYKSSVLMIMSIFFFILGVGEFGMMPYVFTCTSHMMINLSLSFPLWLGGVMYGFFLSWKSAMSHFVPLGCPSGLIPFLVIVEVLSNLIRPISLCMRLMSNMMAGHIIIVLISSAISSVYSNPVSIILIFVQSLLILFEIGVAFVQAYVFSNLVSMYWQEN